MCIRDSVYGVYKYPQILKINFRLPVLFDGRLLQLDIAFRRLHVQLVLYDVFQRGCAVRLRHRQQGAGMAFGEPRVQNPEIGIRDRL